MTDEKRKTDDPAIIAGDIRQTRQQMSQTVNAIEERLSPAHIKEQVTSVKEHVVGQIRDAKAELVSNVHEAKENIKGDIADGIDDAKARVRQATVGRVENMVHDARHVMHDAKETVGDYGSGVIDTIKANPIPAALVAVGLGWLVMSGVRSGGGRRRAYYGGMDEDGYRYAYRYGGPNMGTRMRGPRRLIAKGQRVASSAIHDAREGIGNVGHRVQETAEHLVHDAEDALHGVSASASEVAQRTSQRASALAHDAGMTGRRVVRRAGTQVRRAEQSFESTLRENPLAIGAVAIAIGAAIGLALPHTAKEDELMGPAKEKLLGKAEGLASSALHKVEEKVSDLTSGVSEAPQSKPDGNMPNGKSAHV
jgi:ElaB/YqjD/DUF883 family membrane-anchored ribosome-binding protein